MLNLILWLVVGALIGWLANYGMHNRVGAQFDIMIGMVGALIGGLLIGYSAVNWNVFSPTALLIAYFSAVVLLVIVKLMRTTAPAPID
jgi:uncharacterized membrane protein YeaQ/YmgE (transglycosylase-associated protein family)